MKKNMALASLVLISLISQETEPCSFLYRYGANSYITNIPLFFKQNTQPYKKKLLKDQATCPSLKNAPPIKEAHHTLKKSLTSKTSLIQSRGANASNSPKKIDTDKEIMVNAENALLKTKNT